MLNNAESLHPNLSHHDVVDAFVCVCFYCVYVNCVNFRNYFAPWFFALYRKEFALAPVAHCCCRNFSSKNEYLHS